MAIEFEAHHGPAAAWVPYRTAAIGTGLAVVAAGIGVAVENAPDGWPAVAAALLGVGAMLVGGYAVSRRPKDSVTLGLAALTAFLAAIATNPAWDSIRLMQWVMAATAAFAAAVVRLPVTGQRVAFSLLVLYHFAGIISAMTSPNPTPWLTSQLWARVFRPHLEFSYVNNAYHFYSPQPGPAQVLWFCITGTDGESRWYKTPTRRELLDPLGVEYFRRLSLTERANQTAQFGPSAEVILARKLLSQDFPFYPPEVVSELRQYRPLSERGRQIIHGYAEHVAHVLGTGRKAADGTPVPVHDIKVYLTLHDMLGQFQFQNKKDPYDPETYRPIYEGQFDGDGRPLMNDFDRSLQYWLIPIYRTPTGELVNIVVKHAGSDPFDPRLEWGSDTAPSTEGGPR
jgi:hypothetical protein